MTNSKVMKSKRIRLERPTGRIVIRKSVSALAELSVRTAGINARDHAFAPGVPIIDGRAEPIPQRKIEAGIPDICQAAPPSAGPPRITEGGGLKGASARIPEVLRISQAQRVHFTAHRDRARQMKFRRAVKIFVILPVVERKSRIQPRRRQELKKRAVAVVRRIGIAASERVSGAKPRRRGLDGKLPAEFAGKGPGALRH